MSIPALLRASLVLGLLAISGPVFAVDQATTRSLDELKSEILARSERVPQRSPAVNVKPADVREAIAAIKTLDRDDWAQGFMGVADRYMAKGRALQQRGHAVQAKAAFVDAYRLYKIAHYPTNNSPEKQKAYEKGIEAFLAYASYLTPKVEVVKIPFEGKEIVGYLRLPKATGKVPLVFMVTALDGRKEESVERNEQLLDAGIGIFVVDMPGTGQAPIKGDVNSERMFSAALDYLTKRPEIDAERVGFYGGSWSGYWAVKMAVVEKDRLKAAVSQGTPAHDYFQPEWQKVAVNTPEYLMDLFPARAMVYEVNTLDEFLAYGPRMSLKTQGILDKPSAPLLLVNGTKDSQVPISDLFLAARSLPGSPKEIWVNPNGRHMGADETWGSERIRAEVVTPWLIRHLKAPARTRTAGH